MKLVHSFIIAEIGLEGFSADAFRPELGDEGRGGGGGAVVVDCERAVEGGKGGAGSAANAAGGAGYEGEVGGEVCGQHFWEGCY